MPAYTSDKKLQKENKLTQKNEKKPLTCRKGSSIIVRPGNAKREREQVYVGTDFWSRFYTVLSIQLILHCVPEKICDYIF